MRWLIDIIDSMAMSLINLQEMVKDREAWSTAVLLCLVAQPCPTLCNLMNYSLPGSSVHGNSPGKNTGVGCHALLQGIFLTQGSNLHLLHCGWVIYR